MRNKGFGRPAIAGHIGLEDSGFPVLPASEFRSILVPIGNLVAHIMPRSLPVLVVDDTEICRLGMALLLAHLGFKTDLAENGCDALERFKPGKYAAVIMDYDMTDMTGAQCTKELRRLERETNCRLPVIGMTSHNETEVISQCLEAGMDAVLPKNCQSLELLEVLEPLIFERSVS